jgi:hypothetical protein
MKSKTSIALTTIGITTLVLFGSLPANAVETSESVPPAAVVDPNQNCWLNVVTEEEACAESQEALATLLLEEYNLTIEGEDVPAELQASTSDLARGAITPQATYILGIIYDNANYSTAAGSYTLTTTVSNPCNQAGNYTYGNVPSLGALGGIGSNWNDRISSLQGYGHCGFKLYADNNYAGSTYAARAAAPTMGAFQNQASSLDTRKVD